MPNNDYNHEMFALELTRKARAAENAAYVATELAQKLSAPLPDAYDIDHASERIGWSVKRLREAADALESLQPYARH